MARYVFAVHSNPVEGREDEYNEWYSGRHLQDFIDELLARATERLPRSSALDGDTSPIFWKVL